MKEMDTVKSWLQRLEESDLNDIPLLLDDAPAEIQQLRGAWENPEFSILVQCASAISFLEGILAAHPTMLLEG